MSARPKALIYTVVYGEKFRQCARVLSESLRICGFPGDIVAIADADIATTAARSVVIDMSDVDPIDRRMLRARADEFVTFGDVDVILYLDADIVCRRDPQELIDFVASGVPAVAVHNRPYVTVPGQLALLSLDEIERAPQHLIKPYNSGVVGLVAENWRAFMNQWISAFDSHRWIYDEREREFERTGDPVHRICKDQTALSYAIMMGHVSVRTIPTTLVQMDREFRETISDPVLRHFCRGSKDMNSLLRRMDDEIRSLRVLRCV